MALKRLSNKEKLDKFLTIQIFTSELLDYIQKPEPPVLETMKAFYEFVKFNLNDLE